MIKEDYYSKGSLEEPIFSNSALSTINPEQNGSPLKLRAFFENKEEEKSIGLLRGTIFHAWAENPDDFYTLSVDKPAEKLGLVADAMFSVFSSMSKEDLAKTYLQDGLELNKELQQFLFDVCRAVGWNNNWKFEAIIKNAAPVIPYLQAALNPENEGKIALSKSQRENLETCVNSLKANRTAFELLFHKDSFSNKEYFKEEEFYWTEMVNDARGKEEEVQMKAKLDDLEIDHEKKIVKITDIKTTSQSAYNFVPTFNYYRLGRQFCVYKRAVLRTYPSLADYKFEFRNVVVETNGLFQTVVHRWHPSIIEDFMGEYLALLERASHAFDNDFQMSLEEISGQGEVRHTKEEVNKV